ncbi:uncharacterized protein LOC134262265 [Saccostrea cucullata]|uniref:uncharacterized protein LOC134262265 n=1 Tax=Saccostrea cuccullata TaxID=36930 RepID=UPI002ED2DD44
MPRRRLGPLPQTKTPKWALVLFDWDGCTAVVETKRFDNQQNLQTGCQTNLSFEGRIHLVEILTLTDSEPQVYNRDKEWGRGVRAHAISATRDAREMCRKEKYGGFLDIKEDSESEEDEAEIFVRKTKQPKKQPRVVLSRLSTPVPTKDKGTTVQEVILST